MEFFLLITVLSNVVITTVLRNSIKYICINKHAFSNRFYIIYFFGLGAFWFGS